MSMMNIIDIKKKYGKVAVIMGGNSSEREISLISGNAVFQSLLASGVDAHKFDPAEQSLSDLRTNGFCRAFLVTHGKGGEDGILQGALEYLNIPYTGSGVLASSLAMDKYRTKLIWQTFNIPMPKGQYLNRSSYIETDFKLNLQLPVIVKPTCDGSSLGISKVYELSQLYPAINKAFKSDSSLLIEEMIVGDEFSVTVFKNKVYPIVKIEAPNNEYDYQHKYFSNDTCYICPYDLGMMQKIIEEYALLGYNAIDAQGVARLDFMIDKSGKVYFLEINTLPGMTEHSLVPMAFNAMGVDFNKLCLMVLDEAVISS